MTCAGLGLLVGKLGLKDCTGFRTVGLFTLLGVILGFNLLWLINFFLIVFLIKKKFTLNKTNNNRVFDFKENSLLEILVVNTSWNGLMYSEILSSMFTNYQIFNS